MLSHYRHYYNYSYIIIASHAINYYLHYIIYTNYHADL